MISFASMNTEISTGSSFFLLTYPLYLVSWWLTSMNLQYEAIASATKLQTKLLNDNH